MISWTIPPRKSCRLTKFLLCLKVYLKCCLLEKTNVFLIIFPPPPPDIPKVIFHSSELGKIFPYACLQFSSVAQSCPTLCHPMNCNIPGLPVHHRSRSLPKLMSIESAMPSNHLILCRPLPLLPSIFQASGSFQMSSFSHQVAKVLEFQLQLMLKVQLKHQSFQ